MLLRSARTPYVTLLLGFVTGALLLSSAFGSSTGSSAIEDRTRSAADSTHRGVVWRPPSFSGPALRELSRMHRWGANAVRLTRFPAADTVFAHADSLGIAIYLDLPVSYVGAHAIGDTLTRAQPLLDRIHRLARRHSSIQFVGLVRYGDTTVPAACSTLQRWTQQIHEMDPSLQTYYVTPFRSRHDQCRQTVDRPLLGLQGQSQPVDRWRRWREKESSVGIGALGTWATPGAPSGLRVPHSRERQARHLETALTRLLEDAPPSAVFVYRWSDRDRPALPWRQYGLVDSTGALHPAGEVVRGVYSGRQRVFAFPNGMAPNAHPVAVILFGWAVVGLLAVLYARSPFFRQTSVRYFRAHGFYLDAVRHARDIRPSINILLLLVGAGTLGTILTLAADLLHTPPATGWVLAALPTALQWSAERALAFPYATGAVTAGISIGGLGLWVLLLTLAAQWTNRLSVGQSLMLVVWPFWPVLFGGMIALVGATAPPVPIDVLAVVLLVGGAGTVVSTTIRVLYDYWTLTGTPLAIVVLLALPSPLGLFLLGIAALQVKYDIPAALLRHLMTRT